MTGHPAYRTGKRGRGAWLAGLATLVLVSAPGASAAPLPPLEPMDVCGIVRSARWLEPLELPPAAGMSGSAARIRSWPGRHVVVLGEVTGIDPADVGRVNALLSTSRDGAGSVLAPGELLLVLTDSDQSRLSSGMAICVSGFRIRGDEGGTWTFHDDLKATPAPAE